MENSERRILSDEEANKMLNEILEEDKKKNLNGDNNDSNEDDESECTACTKENSATKKVQDTYYEETLTKKLLFSKFNKVHRFKFLSILTQIIFISNFIIIYSIVNIFNLGYKSKYSCYKIFHHSLSVIL